MLVIISDLHLTDGSSGRTINAGAFRLFRERLRDLAYDASWRPDKTYKPVDRIDVVLLGDILDVIRSTRWLQATVRPWTGYSSAPLGAHVTSVTDGILQANAESLSIIKSLSSGAISLPPATAAGKPADSSVARVPVDVHVHYLIGNHDWFYAIPGQAFDALRSRIKDVMGLSGTGMFLHDPFSSEALMEIYRRHDLFARHGDIFDAFNFEGDRLASSLGDAIVVELLNRFPLVVENELGTQLSKECLAGLREIDNVRPLLLVPVWITGLLRRTCLDTELRDRVKRIWDRLADEFLDLDFVSQRQWTSSLFGSVTKLRWAIKFSQGVSLDHLSEVTAWVTSKLATSDGPFYPNAFGEKTFLSGEAKYIIYGHTHHHEIVPLDIRDRGTSSINQIYFNSGTWRAVHDQAQFRRSEQEFAGFHVLTYLAFFCEGERGGHPFETWSGALAFEDGQ